MRPSSIFGGIAAGMLIFLGAFATALAQDGTQANDTQQGTDTQQGADPQLIEQLGEDPSDASNPPGRVAQLSYAEGSVSLEPAGASDWTSAALNRPVTFGDRLWADQSSRAELDIGDAVIRLGSGTGFSFLNLDEQIAQMQVTAGTVIVHVRSLASGEQDEIDTPNLALTLQQPGTYRVEVSDSGDATIVKVDDGEALATGGGQSYPIAAQQSVTFTGTSTLAADYANVGGPDPLDEWSMQRDQQEQQQAAAAQQYVSPDVVGADDLSTYGTWENTPDWGYAWFPNVAVVWTPYSRGYWVWVSPWGWTWIDQEPWGFAPSHYGRWGYWGKRWCWIPGPRRSRPIYAPAVVGWVGGPRGGASGSLGARVGWFPLGPRDVYVPGYHAGPRYVRDINAGNSRLVNPVDIRVHGGRAASVRYANSAIPGAITAVPRNVFTSAQPVGAHRINMPHQTGANFRASTAAPAIVPVRQSVLGVNAGRAVRMPPRAIVDRPVVARLAPPRAPVSFAREQAAIRANGGRPVPVTELTRMRPNTPAVRVRLASPLDNRRTPFNPSMSARERTLQQPTLSPGGAPRNDRPGWVQGRPAQPGVPMQRSRPQTFAPQRQQAPQEWHSPPHNQVAPPQRQVPQQHFAPPPRQVPQQHFAPPPRQVPQQHFAPPPRQVPEQRFAPPPRQIPQQHFTSPSYNPPPMRERAPMPREAPARPSEGRSQGRSEGRPPSEQRPRVDRADAAPAALEAGYAQQFPSTAPMYRPQESSIRYATPAGQPAPARTPFRAPMSPPPMYRPVTVGGGGAAATSVPRGPQRLAFGRTRGAG